MLTSESVPGSGLRQQIAGSLLVLGVRMGGQWWPR